MPSPIGHCLGGIAAGLIVAPLAASTRGRWIQIGAFAAIGAAPDLDLLTVHHRAEAHSVGAAVIVAAMAMLTRWPLARSRLLVGLAAFAAWFSHPILDTVGTDTSRPLGVMMWWPFSTAYVYAHLEWFMPIWRRWWVAGTIAHDLRAALREVLILGPLAAMVWWVRQRTTNN